MRISDWSSDGGASDLRQPRHHLENPGEVGALFGAQFGERDAAARFILGEDHPAHRGNARGVEEHMTGAAQPDALRSEARRVRKEWVSPSRYRWSQYQ